MIISIKVLLLILSDIYFCTFRMLLYGSSIAVNVLRSHNMKSFYFFLWLYVLICIIII